MESPQIGPKRVLYQDQYSKIYSVTADFGHFTKEYFVRDSGVRAGVVASRHGSILLVKQYRLLVNRQAWEIPGGKVEEGERPEVAAMRECLEETGIRCLNLRPLIFFHLGLDVSYNPTHLFSCNEVVENPEPHRFDDQEVVAFDWVPLSRCIEMIFEGQILDNFTILAILAYQAKTATET